MNSKYLLLCLIVLVLSCNSEITSEKFTINGTLDGDYSDYIYLSYPNFKDSTYLIKDSIKVIDGQFSFTGKVNFPLQGWINLKPPASIDFLYIENTNINIEASYSLDKERRNLNVINFDTIIGSKTEDLSRDFAAFYQKHQKDKDFSTQLFETAKRLAIEHPQNSFTGSVLGQTASMSSHFSYDQALEIYKLIDTSYQSTDDLMMIKSGLEKLQKITVGKPILDFELPDINENMLSTTTFRGKTTLIDFWASWCKPCRIKHPKYRELYNKYNDAGFDILSVSIDTSTEPWKKAITKDSITWSNVIDTGGFNGKTATDYFIQAIPASYLVNENGNVIGNNLSPEEIEVILKAKKALR